MIFITIKKLQKKKVLILEKSLSPIVYLKLMALSGRLGITVHKDLRWHNSQSMLYQKPWVFSHRECRQGGLGLAAIYYFLTKGLVKPSTKMATRRLNNT